MVIRYKEYVGTLIYMEQILGGKFYFKLQDIDNTIISFKAEINEIRIVDCIGNFEILSEIKNS